MSDTTLLAIWPQFLVEDIVRAAEFYRDKLGFTIGPYDEEAPLFVIVRRDKAQIMLNKSEDGHVASNRTHKEKSDDAYIWVSDLDTFWDEVHDNVKIVRELATAPYGIKEFSIEDSSGYTLTFAQAQD
jgi:predicted enzyme related to lactoylglutathione lyase